MTTFRIGEMNLTLEVIGEGARNALLSRPVDARWKLSRRERVDFKAFKDDGWEFWKEGEIEWKSLRPRNPRLPVEAGLLAIHPSGGLVIIKYRMVVDGPLGLETAAFEARGRRATRLPFGQNLYSIDMGLPDGNLRALLESELSAQRAESAARGPTRIAEPVLAYNVNLPRDLKQRDPIQQWQWGKINLFDAWTEGNTRGTGVRVAVIDCGFHRRDPQIRDRIASWARMRPDGQWEFNGRMPENPHGTFCAGLVAAIVDGKAVHGAAPDAELILVAVKSSGVVDQVELGEAITKCARGFANGLPADVISCSLGLRGSWEKSGALKAAIDEASSLGPNGRGIPIVWADFNESKPIEPDSLESYPPLLIVAQSTEADLCVSSGFGSGLDLMAPGDSVVGIDWNQGVSKVATGSGCSFAAPIVAGVAALLLSVNPNLTAQDVARIIVESCDPQPSNPSNPDGVGRLNALEAIIRARQLAAA
jgi:hypothetical protein